MKSFTLIVALFSIAMSAAQVPAGYYNPVLPKVAPSAAPVPHYKTGNFQPPFFPAGYYNPENPNLAPGAAPVPSYRTENLQTPYLPVGYYNPENPNLAPIVPPANIAPGAAPIPSYRTENFQTPYLSKSENRDDAGQYSLSYVTANGIRVTDRTYLKPGPKKGNYVPVREGTYQYISPEGVPVAYGYRADENGYVVTGYPLPFAHAPPQVRNLKISANH